MKYVYPTVSGEAFTRGKLYPVIKTMSDCRVFVKDDSGCEVIVRIDGEPSFRLNHNGIFKVLNMITDPKEVIGYAEKTGKEALNSMANQMILDGKISDGKIYASDSPSNEYAKVLHKLREILRVPDGENILTHAKVVRVLADGLIGLQK